MDTQGRELRQLAGLLVAAAVVANLAFVGLSSVFDYPDVLQEPAADVLAAFHANRIVVSALFVLLAVAAALLAPVAIGLSRLTGDPRMRLARWLGVAAATVQVIGLLRWPVIVPVLADQATEADRAAEAARIFDVVGTVLGTVVGETFGYLLTAAWTILVALSLAGAWLSRALAAVGLSSALLIASGVLVPLGLPGVDLANFGGYVLWSLWLIGVGMVLWRRSRRMTGARSALVRHDTVE